MVLKKIITTAGVSRGAIALWFVWRSFTFHTGSIAVSVDYPRRRVKAASCTSRKGSSLAVELKPARWVHQERFVSP